MTPSAPSPDQLEFYYHGFHRVLRRYRSATITGWVITFAGVAGIPLGWNAGRTHGLLDLLLCGCAIAAGLILVSEAVSFLGAYAAVPFPPASPDTGSDGEPELVQEIRLLMKEVESGGWQEAYAAIGTLKALGLRHGLPAPEQRGGGS